MSSARQNPSAWQDSPGGELDEEKFVEVVAALAGPTQTVKQAAEATGIPLITVKRILERRRSQHAATFAAIETLEAKHVIKGLKDRTALTLDAMAPEKIAAASYRDQATALGIMLQHHETLQGRPSSILAFEPRHKLEDVAGLLLAEMRRRGMVVDAHAEDVQVFPAGEGE